jgi:hypothetical protein
MIPELKTQLKIIASAALVAFWPLQKISNRRAEKSESVRAIAFQKYELPDQPQSL